MGFDSPFPLLTHDVAIDLGTANTLIAQKGRGIVLDEPSVVAVRQDQSQRQVVAVGTEAKQMLGRTPESISAARPLRHGTIIDYHVAEAMLRYFFARAVGQRGFFKPRVAVCVPHQLEEVERRAVQESARAAGGGEIHLIEGVLAAALGAELPIMDPVGTMICDIGAGTAEMAVISLGGIVSGRTDKTAGDEMDQAIVEWMADEHRVLIGENTAETIKLEIGRARESANPRIFAVNTRDLNTGTPRKLEISSDGVAGALAPIIRQLIEAIRLTLEATPPELAADILDSGLVLSGGSALLPGLCEEIRDCTGLPVVLAPDPLRSVAHGAAIAIENRRVLQEISR